MLEFDYSRHYAHLANAIDWQIRLPEAWPNFFKETGIMPVRHAKQWQPQRRIVRTTGLLYFPQPLAIMPRGDEPIGVYTRDFSRDACGLISPVQLYPEEGVRLVLPTFWLNLLVVRCRRQSEACYEVGAKLLTRHDPDRSAFGVHLLDQLPA